MKIYVSMTFDSAHRLPNVPEGHRCSNLHGHTFVTEIHVTGDTGEHTGWVCDFGDIKALAKPLINQLDHHYLNDIEGLENPTSENIAMWIWNKLRPQLPNLFKVVVKESPTSAAIYKGE
ncbi:6-carboxytetrahydropterin synthase QueD [Maridesulfovibrio frigidus]|uniref:6-carboxytetrahydropterin synthase QueD n=1 Tax=Maridesulfovibrio frigidus TaxID=340956 RepID=UPI0004E1DD36|nr:6-carboxytetrahydropterin synthase QueD [Maridesulfovibrio frigidus]